MKTAHQSRDRVGVFRMKIIVFTVEVSWHYTAIVTTILTVIGFTQLDARNLGNRIGLIGFFQGARQQCRPQPSAA